MSADDPARQHFLAWARQGIGATLTNDDGGGSASLPMRASLTVGLNVDAAGPNSTTPVPPVAVQIFGPGDVLGIDPRHVVRTEPRDSTTNFEPNYLAGIEFDTPDFPWLFTPAAPAGDRLRPWIALIVLSPAEYAPVPAVVHPLPAIDVTSMAALQPLDDAWNWAHAQVSGDGGLAATVASSPSAVISRLLCPRRLSPETAYTAFVVPAFEIGRQAGLGLDVSAVTTADPAWTPLTMAPLRLPVYYQWRFHTSDQGDFESLVRRLTPRKLGAAIGQRPMAVDDPMPEVPSAGAPLGLEGALRSLLVEPTTWEDPAKTQFQTVVQALVNRTLPLVDDPTGPDPQVVPPMYGRWPAGVRSVDRGSTGWLDGLNLDPRNRVSAGMGTQVVQGRQTALMASAWQQVAGVEAANAKLRAAQLARATMALLHAQVAATTTPTVLALTGPLHAKVLTSATTVRAAIDASRIPRRLLSPAARRITHPTSVIRRRQLARLNAPTPAPGGGSIGALIERVNANTLAIVPASRPPGGLVALEDVSAAVAPPWPKGFPSTVVGESPVVDKTPVATAARPSGAADVKATDVKATGVTVIGVTAVGVTVVGVASGVLSAIAARPTFAVTAPGTTVVAQVPGTDPTKTGGADSADAVSFRQAFASLAGTLGTARPDPPLAPALDADALRTTISTRLDPTITVPKRVLSLVQVSPHLGWQPSDPIREIMAAPAFPQPMYEPLRDLSEQYILPGADQIPADTVGVLETNHAFVEAYMVGLSHEMARQLLFAGYPTDCMGTYFHQFWDVSGYVPQPGDPADPAALAERLRDIPAIVTWPPASGLGDHDNRSDIVPDNLVLIIRGELLRRYPDAIIYAARAAVSGNQRVIDPSDEQHPIFGGSLPGAMTFLGFNLSAADAKGGTANAPDGFFFVFQQHPTGPRFGLEPSAPGPVTQWADLAWTNFGGAAPTTARSGSILAARNKALVAPWTELRLASSTLGAVLADQPLPAFLSAAHHPSGVTVTGADAANQWGVDSAQTAYITARLPFRVAIHADLMVP